MARRRKMGGKGSKSAPGTTTIYPGKYTDQKSKLRPKSGFGSVTPGGPGPASSKSRIGK